MIVLGLSYARACLVAAAVDGHLPYAHITTLADATSSESYADARRRCGAPPWHRSGMCLTPGRMVTGWSEVGRRVITRIGVTGVSESLVLPTALALDLRLQPAVRL